VISSAVANTAAIFKNYLPNLDVEILCRDFTSDNMEREVLAYCTYDVAHEFVPLYDFFSLTVSDDNNSPETL
jgi:hypothetical protein